MTLRAIVQELGLEVCAAAEHLDREVRGGYAGDLLSDCAAMLTGSTLSRGASVGRVTCNASYGAP